MLSLLWRLATTMAQITRTHKIICLTTPSCVPKMTIVKMSFILTQQLRKTEVSQHTSCTWELSATERSKPIEWHWSPMPRSWSENQKFVITKKWLKGSISSNFSSRLLKDPVVLAGKSTYIVILRGWNCSKKIIPWWWSIFVSIILGKTVRTTIKSQMSSKSSNSLDFSTGLILKRSIKWWKKPIWKLSRNTTYCSWSLSLIHIWRCRRIRRCRSRWSPYH